MDSIIDHIHNTLEAPVVPSTGRRAKILSQLDPIMEQIVDEFGLSFTNRLTDLHGELSADNEDREFRLGFITGARLMMEVLG